MSQEEKEESKTGLIVVEKTTAMAVFTESNKLDPLLAKITACELVGVVVTYTIED